MTYTTLFFLLCLFSVAGVVLLILGITRSKKVLSIVAGGCLLIAGFIGMELVGRAINKGLEYGKSKVDRIDKELQEASLERSGATMYKDIFGKYHHGCVQVVHKRDAVVPVIDASMIMHFKCCRKEVDRILENEEYTVTKMAKDRFYGSGGYADWFQPEKLDGDSILKIEYETDDKFSWRTLYMNSDSTEAYFLDAH